MVTQVKSRRIPASSNAAEFNSRQLLLAGLGAVSLTRKQGVRLYGSLVHEGRLLQLRANDTVVGARRRIDLGIVRARGRINDVVAPIRGRINDVVTPIRDRAETTFASVRSGVETRLQPVLARFGFKAKAQRAKATVRKAGKRPVRRVRNKAA